MSLWLNNPGENPRCLIGWLQISFVQLLKQHILLYYVQRLVSVRRNSNQFTLHTSEKFSLYFLCFAFSNLQESGAMIMAPESALKAPSRMISQLSKVLDRSLFIGVFRMDT